MCAAGDGRAPPTVRCCAHGTHCYVEGLQGYLGRDSAGATARDGLMR